MVLLLRELQHKTIYSFLLVRWYMHLKIHTDYLKIQGWFTQVKIVNLWFLKCSKVNGNLGHQRCMFQIRQQSLDQTNNHHSFFQNLSLKIHITKLTNKQKKYMIFKIIKLPTLSVDQTMNHSFASVMMISRHYIRKMKLSIFPR